MFSDSKLTWRNHIDYLSKIITRNIGVINPNPIGILARNLPESSKIHSALLETCPYLQNAPCIFVDLSCSVLMACTSCQVVIVHHLKRWKYQFITQWWIFPKIKCPLEDFDGFGVVRVNRIILFPSLTMVFLLGNCSTSNLYKLLILQKQTLRIINSVDFYAYLFFKHRTLKIKDIYYHQIGSLMYQSVFNTLPTFINASFRRNNEIHTHSTQQALHFHLPLTRTYFAQKPRSWNSLPEPLRKSTNIYSFKWDYKSFLLNLYCEPV